MHTGLCGLATRCACKFGEQCSLEIGVGATARRLRANVGEKGAGCRAQEPQQPEASGDEQLDPNSRKIPSRRGRARSRPQVRNAGRNDPTETRGRKKSRGLPKSTHAAAGTAAPRAQGGPPKPVRTRDREERRRIEAPTKEQATKQAKASTPSTMANNVGVGRSDADSNYAGLVSAHLRRHQQYPADARSRGDQGTATVSFSLDGGGRVTSSQLVRGSGISSIDQEVQAMVRRASPFPGRRGARCQLHAGELPAD